MGKTSSWVVLKKNCIVNKNHPTVHAWTTIMMMTWW